MGADNVEQVWFWLSLIKVIITLFVELAERDPVPMGFFCFSAMPLREEDPPPEISDLLERIDALYRHCGDVLLFRERELYGMTTLVNRYTKEPIRFVLGLSLLVRVWEYRYTHLPGSFLEGLSRLLPQNVRIYAYPMSSKDLSKRFKASRPPAGSGPIQTDGSLPASFILHRRSVTYTTIFSPATSLSRWRFRELRKLSSNCAG